MRKVVLSIMVSLDGFIEDANKEIEWHVWDEEMSAYMTDFFTTVDTIIFGRKTYELMAAFWPTSASKTEDATIAGYMNKLRKIIFSKTLSTAEWNNTQIAAGEIEAEIATLKKEEGKDLVIFGGAEIASAFMNRGLIDEYRLVVNPVVLGNGSPLFQDVKEKLALQLVATKSFSCGNVLLHYKPLR